MARGVVAVLQRVAAVDDWTRGPPDPFAPRIRPRFRLRRWTLGLVLSKAQPGGEAFQVEAGMRLPPRRKRRRREARDP